MTFKVMLEGTATSPRGFQAGAAACGLKESKNLDVALLFSENNCAAAGVFTRNQVAAAPVILDREILAASRNRIRGVVANAGNANACNGRQGLIAAREMGLTAAAQFGLDAGQFLVMSTGVIGLPLPLDKVKRGIREASQTLSAEGGLAAAKAIMTTDTRPKNLAVRLDLPAGPVIIGGMAKGSGMIHPDMATLLGIVTTDAAIPAETLGKMLKAVVDSSFNCISIDGDTSTNDTILLLANGASGVRLIDDASKELFFAGLSHVCVELAKMVVRDGEGVTRFVTIRVTGATSQEAAHRVAATIATSPLVKTALAGGDPNWGRVLAAAGRAGVVFDQEQTSLWIGSPGQQVMQLVDQGGAIDYSESEAEAIFAQPEIDITLDLGQSGAEATVWTGDLTHDYVTINADYRT